MKVEPGKYNIIYADPPWSYNNFKQNLLKHYTTMDLNSLKKLKIPIADEAICFMWVTYPQLKEGIELMEYWGFEYKTVGFVWIKITPKNNLVFGMGNYTRANSEMVLLGVTRKFSIKSIESHSISQVVVDYKREHSRKPDIIRDKIVELCGDYPRIELFARQVFPGWNAFGNETDKFNPKHKKRKLF